MTDSLPPRASVVLFGTYNAAVHDRVAVLREGLVAAGHQLTELNAPLRAGTDDRIAAARSASGAVRFALDLLRCWVRLVALRVAHRGRPDAVVVGYLGHFDVHLARLLWPRSLIVLDHMVSLSDTAADRSAGSGRTQRLLAAVDRRATGAADVVLVDTEEHVSVVDADHRGRCLVVPVGASQMWHDAGARPGRPDPDAAPLRVVFFGQYTPLQGCPTIGEAAALLAERDDVAITMVGNGQDRAATQAAAAGADVRWIDWLDPADLVEEVRSHHVALGVFGTGPKGSRVVPHKVFQSLAVGCAVVTSATPPQERLLGDGARYCPPGDAAALAATLAGLADDRAGLRTALTGASRSAARFRPVEVVAPLSRLIDGRTGSGAPHQLRPPALSLNACLRWDLAEPVLARLPPGRVLEVGPGRGAVAARLVEMGHVYTGAELAPEARAHTTAMLAARDGSARVVSSTDELGTDEQFDLVCAFEVLEHIEDDAGSLSRWAELLTDGGTLVLSVPADPDRFAAADTAVGHLRRYRAEELAGLAEQAGLVDVEVRHYGAGLGDLLEHGRNVLLGRRTRSAESRGKELGVEDRTARSGTVLQPPAAASFLTRLLTAPGRRWQRTRPDEGPGLLLVGRRPG